MLKLSPLLILPAAVMFTGVFAAAAEDAEVPAIELLTGVKPPADVFEKAKRRKPLAIATVEEAGNHYSEEELEAVKKKINFDKQTLLIFAWRGSGQDKLEYVVAESFPEQITFTIVPGRTRDLRPHIHMFAVRSNVKWSLK